MIHKDFNSLLERRIKLTRETLASKSKEYASSDDKLSNFKKTALMRRSEKHPTECLQGMMDKHLTSYFDMLDKVKNGESFSFDLVDEKIGDIINYFILQEALIKEYLIEENERF